MPFTGVPLAALDFYEELEADNSKTFWTAHKSIYESAVRDPLLQLSALLEREFGAGKAFRPYRDVRFSADKTPYKTSQGVWFDQSGMYLQVSAAGLMLGGGHWRSSPEEIAQFRRAVDDEFHGPALEKTVTSLRRRGWEIAGDTLVRVPAGYAKDHPRAELLRHKTLTAHQDLGCPDWLTTPEAAAEIARRWRQLLPLNGWLRDHLS